MTFNISDININTVFIILNLRAGNEKDGDEQADTVGCCSLRVEHIELHDQKVSILKNSVEVDLFSTEQELYMI